MGKLKALLKYDRTTFIETILLKMLNVCDEINVVLGHEAEKIKNEINNKNLDKKIKFVLNPDFSKGMTTSLQAGVKEIDNTDWILYHFVDQPGLPEKFYKQFVATIEENCDWIQPQYSLRNGHPILINKNLFHDILTLKVENSLRDVSHKTGIRKKYWECSFHQIFQDIDRPKDYKQLVDT